MMTLKKKVNQTIAPEKDEEETQQEPEASIKTNGFHPEVEVEDPRIAPRLAPSQSLVAPSPQDVQYDTIAAPVPAPLPTLPPAPLLEPSFNFLQDSQIDLESPHMDPAVVMVHPPKRPPLQGGGGPPGIPAATFSNPAFQAQMAGLTPSQQAQVIAQQQALLSNGGRPGGQQQPLPQQQQQSLPPNSAAPQQHQSSQVMSLAQQQQG